MRKNRRRSARLAEKLSQCVTALTRARKEAHGLALDLRVIADCFDAGLPDVNFVEVHQPNVFTFRDTRDVTERHKFPRSQPQLQTTSGSRPLVRIPEGTTLLKLIELIQELSQEAEEFDSQLRNEGVDVSGISKTLRKEG